MLAPGVGFRYPTQKATPGTGVVYSPDGLEVLEYLRIRRDLAEKLTEVLPGGDCDPFHFDKCLNALIDEHLACSKTRGEFESGNWSRLPREDRTTTTALASPFVRESSIHHELVDPKFGGSGAPPPPPVSERRTSGPEVQRLGTLSAIYDANSESSPRGAVRTEDTSMGQQPYRWWKDRSKACIERKRERGEAGKNWLDREARILERFPGDVWPRVGVMPSPSSAAQVTRGQVIALRDADPSVFRGTTRSQYLQALREYLRFERNPIANERALWSVDTSDVRRRWLTKTQLGSLWSICHDEKDRLIVAMLGFNGLRRIELLRLRIRDLTLIADLPRAHVLGKGRGAGKWREIPLSSMAYGALVEATSGRPGGDRVYLGQRTDVDSRLFDLGQLAGIPVRVSSHDLRRSFGRIAYYSRVPLVDLQHIYGHSSPTTTAHYIGIDLAEMAAGLALFDEVMRGHLEVREPRKS